MAKSVQPRKQLSLVSFMTTKDGLSDDKRDDQGGEPSSSDTDEMLSEPSCSSTVPESGSQSCDVDCCSLIRDKPNQPTSKDVLSGTKRMQGSQARYVQSSWFKQHSWLSLCTSRQKLFCFPCVTAVCRILLVFSKNAEASFVSSGFCNWRKASESFRNMKQAMHTLKLY